MALDKFKLNTMSKSISPVNVEVVEDEEIEQYDLPESGETAFNVDVSEKGYTIEWRVSKDFGVKEYENFLWNLNYSTEEKEALMTIESEGRSRALLYDLARLEGYPEDCTYFRVEIEEFDLEWESWTDSNRIMLSSPGENTAVLNHIFADFYEDYYDQLLGDLHRLALQQANAIIDQDPQKQTDSK